MFFVIRCCRLRGASRIAESPSAPFEADTRSFLHLIASVCVYIYILCRWRERYKLCCARDYLVMKSLLSQIRRSLLASVRTTARAALTSAEGPSGTARAHPATACRTQTLFFYTSCSRRSSVRDNSAATTVVAVSRHPTMPNNVSISLRELAQVPCRAASELELFISVLAPSTPFPRAAAHFPRDLFSVIVIYIAPVIVFYSVVASLGSVPLVR